MRVVAILGASSRADRYANLAQKMLTADGHKVVPVNPRETQVLGVPVIASLSQIQEPVDTLTLYVGPTKLAALTDEIIQLHPTRVIFNPGTENPSVEQQLSDAGIEVVRACTLVMLRSGQF